MKPGNLLFHVRLNLIGIIISENVILWCNIGKRRSSVSDVIIQDYEKLKINWQIYSAGAIKHGAWKIISE